MIAFPGVDRKSKKYKNDIGGKAYRKIVFKILVAGSDDYR